MDPVFYKIIDRDNYMKTIDRVHEEVHAGHHFTATYEVTGAANSTSYLVFQTVSTSVYPHLTAGVSCNAPGRFYFTANATASSSYTVIPSYNNNFGSASTATAVIGFMPTSSGVSTETHGTILEGGWAGGGKGNFSAGGDTTNRHEWIINGGKKCCLKFSSTEAYTVIFDVFWYEENA
jgi:hypothetical protein